MSPAGVETGSHTSHSRLAEAWGLRQCGESDTIGRARERLRLY